jgi:hypothetical protein
MLTYIVENAAMRFGALARAVSVLHAHRVGNFFLVFFRQLRLLRLPFLLLLLLRRHFVKCHPVCETGCTECGPVSTSLASWPRTLGA